MNLDLKGLVELAHGRGGRASTTLINELFARHFDNEYLRQASDQAVLPRHPQRLAIATDSHVISPLFFPGGDIGSLSVYGTVNDVVLSGAIPAYLSAGFILEEGFPLRDLDKIVESMAAAAEECGVSIVTGDTKLVEQGQADGVYINTTGVGYVPDHLNLSPSNIRPGDKILLSGTLGDHGVAILAARKEVHLKTKLVSDCQPLHDLTMDMLVQAPDIRVMRDPTCGGLSACLNELAQSAGVSMILEETSIPVLPEVKAVTELLGLDPLSIANEGKLVAICPAHSADRLLALMRQHPKARNAAIIGEVLEDTQGFVSIKTALGGSRLIDWQWADSLPRIC